MIELFSGQTGTGNGTAKAWSGGRGSFIAYGTFGGGTVKLQASPDGGTTWVDLLDENGSALSTNAAAVLEFHLAGGVQVRANLAGGTGPYNVNARIF